MKTNRVIKVLQRENEERSFTVVLTLENLRGLKRYAADNDMKLKEATNRVIKKGLENSKPSKSGKGRVTS